MEQSRRERWTKKFKRARASARSRTRQSKSQSNRDWWPDQLNLKILHQNSSLSNPMGEDFDYAEEFKKLDLEGAEEGSTQADDRLAGLVAGRFWPLWTGLFIRMAWH